MRRLFSRNSTLERYCIKVIDSAVLIACVLQLDGIEAHLFCEFFIALGFRGKCSEAVARPGDSECKGLQEERFAYLLSKAGGDAEAEGSGDETSEAAE